MSASNVIGQMDTLFFEQSQVTVNVLAPAEIFSIGFNNADRTQLIEAPASIVPLVQEAVNMHWKGGAGQS